MMPIKMILSFMLVIVGLGFMWLGVGCAWATAKTGSAAKWVLAP
jgi:hypothetical protein